MYKGICPEFSRSGQSTACSGRLSVVHTLNLYFMWRLLQLRHLAYHSGLFKTIDLDGIVACSNVRENYSSNDDNKPLLVDSNVKYYNAS